MLIVTAESLITSYLSSPRHLTYFIILVPILIKNTVPFFSPSAPPAKETKSAEVVIKTPAKRNTKCPNGDQNPRKMKQTSAIVLIKTMSFLSVFLGFFLFPWG